MLLVLSGITLRHASVCYHAGFEAGAVAALAALGTETP